MVDVIAEPTPIEVRSSPRPHRSAPRRAARPSGCSSAGRPSSSATSSSSAGSSRAILGDRITPYDPFNQFFIGHEPPSPAHLMGTDRLGRDVLSRVMVGARDVLIIAPLAALLGVIAGTLLGLVMGYYGGAVDDVLSRIVEAFLALPVVLIASADAGRARLVTSRRGLRGRHPVHADRRPDRALGGARRSGSSTTSRRPSCAANRGCSSCSRRSSRTSSGRSSSR